MAQLEEREFSDFRVPTDNDGNPFPEHIVERGEELPNGIDVSPDESVDDTFDRFLHFLAVADIPVSGVEEIRYDRYEGSLHEVFSITLR